MAQQTFLNLKPQRREKIIDTCLREFALNDYQSASLSAIVEAVGVAKGSFYRYFDSKRSLYLYLLDYAINYRMTTGAAVFSGETKTFEQMLIQNYGEKIAFDLKYPVISRFLYNASLEKNSAELGDIQKMIRSRIMEMTIPIVEQYQQKNGLRKDISAEVVAFQVMQSQFALTEYLEWKYDFTFRGNILKEEKIPSISQKEILSIASTFANMLIQGISNK